MQQLASASAKIKKGDLVRVITSNDTLVKVGSFGLIESTQGYGGEPDKVIICFNFMTPYTHLTQDGEVEYVSASGGPVKQISISKIRVTNNKAKTWRHIHDGKDHTTEWHNGLPYKKHHLSGFQFDVPVTVPVHDLFLVDVPDRDAVSHIALEPPIRIGDPNLQILTEEKIFDDLNFCEQVNPDAHSGYRYIVHRGGSSFTAFRTAEGFNRFLQDTGLSIGADGAGGFKWLNGGYRLVSLAGTKEALDDFARRRGLRASKILSNGRYTRAYIEQGQTGNTIYYLNPNYPREELPYIHE